MLDFDLPEPSCLYPQHALELEWLDTNGRGGYAGSTVMNCHTRKYHGLLVANLDRPAGRHVMLSKFEDSLALGKEEHFLSCHQYPGFFFPQARPCLSNFNNDPAPCFTYSVGGMMVLKTIMLLEDEDTLLIRYVVENSPSNLIPLKGTFSGNPLRDMNAVKKSSSAGKTQKISSNLLMLRLRPFLAFRGFHGLAQKNSAFSPETVSMKNGFEIQPYPEMPPLFITASREAKFFPAPHWYLNFEYGQERARGYDWREDLFHPGIIEIPIKKGEAMLVAASLRTSPTGLERKWGKENRRRLALREKDDFITVRFAEEDRENLRQLLRAARQFLIRTTTGRPAVIAGYHWFGDWGRDTLISLPGLTFCCGQEEVGMAILASLGRHEKDGLLPNYFAPDDEDNAYNSVDASLWYFWAVQQMLKYGGTWKKVKQDLWPVMKNIIKKFMSGTIYGIYMEDNGLLHSGDEGTPLTWMDAQVGGRPVTPRGGIAVEINALWYNALCFAGELARASGEVLFPPDLPDRVKYAFRETFWIAEGAYLGDVYAGGVLDSALRPNQIFALSLPFSPLTPTQATGVLKRVREDLLTPCGLRTLAPGDKAYRERCEGDQDQRDSAYHQGTVWPWLLAAFGEASLRFAEDREEARLFLLNHVRTFLRQHLGTAGLGTVSEIFDGDPPHAPRGCISQAWSVGEMIRLNFLLQER